jgi:hypothetical protein
MEFQYPHLLQKLKFEGRISPLYFEGLTSGLFNLKLLTLHWKTVGSLTQSVLEPLYFPSLVTLDIYGGFDINLHAKVSYDRLRDFVENLMILLENVFLSLRVLKLALPDHIRFLMLLTYSLLVFLERHSQSLMMLNIELISFAHTDLPKGLESRIVSYKHTPEIRDRMQEVGSKMNLKSLSFSTFSAEQFGISYLAHWLQFIFKQNSLKEFQGTGLYLRSDLTQAIVSNNFTTLTSLDLCVLLRESSGVWTPFDCKIVSQCASLHKLSIEGMETLNCFGVSGITNVHLLPQSLKSLSLKKIPIFTDTVNYLCLELHSLSHLRLISIGETSSEADPGVVSTQVISSVMKRKQLKSFAFSWDCVIYDGDVQFTQSDFFRDVWMDLIKKKFQNHQNTNIDDTIEIRLIHDTYTLWSMSGS